MKWLIIFLLCIDFSLGISVSPPELILEDNLGSLFVSEGSVIVENDNFEFVRIGKFIEVRLIEKRVCEDKIIVTDNNKIQTGIEVNVINPDCHPEIFNPYFITICVLIVGIIISKLMRVI
jgi:hypothetical protein